MKGEISVYISHDSEGNVSYFYTFILMYCLHYICEYCYTYIYIVYILL